MSEGCEVFGGCGAAVKSTEHDRRTDADGRADAERRERQHNQMLQFKTSINHRFESWRERERERERGGETLHWENEYRMKKEGTIESSRQQRQRLNTLPSFRSVYRLWRVHCVGYTPGSQIVLFVELSGGSVYLIP